MNEAWRKSAADPQFRVLDASNDAPRVPEWVRDEHVLRSLGTEFAEGADSPPDGPTRRQFLQVMGASIAMASAGGCMEQPLEPIVPYVRPPEQLVPGKPLYYATAMTYAGASLGLLVETHMGRPIKVEGNPLHPAVPAIMPAAVEAVPDRLRFGATDAFAQSVVLSLYDPDRSQTILRDGQITTWEFLYTELRAVLEQVAPGGGQGFRILTDQIVSPTLAQQLQQFLSEHPNARWHHYEPVNDDNAQAGAQLAFGQDVSAFYMGEPAVVLSLDCNCLAEGPMHLQLARMIRGQRVAGQAAPLTRLYVAESSLTVTGAAADHRLLLGPSGLIKLAAAVARGLGLQLENISEAADGEIPQAFVDAVVNDLQAARGKSLIVAGRAQPPVVHAIAHWLNDALGNVGQTVQYVAPVLHQTQSSVESLKELVRAMQAGEVSALVILGGNPAYDAPADVPFAAALEKVPFSLHHSQYPDETSLLCGWHVPKAHEFESWDDTRASNGAATIVQPLIAPLHGGKTPHELLAALAGNPDASSYDLVRGFWRNQLGEGLEDAEFERLWQTSLHDGVIDGTAAEPVTPTINENLTAVIVEQLAKVPAAGGEKAALTITFRPDPSVWDGRFANNAWLQELPRPLTKLTWDNAALMHPLTASAQGLTTGDVVEIEVGKRQIAVPVLAVAGHPRDTVTLHLGYGRKRAGDVGTGIGTNVYPVRTSDAMWFAEVTALRKTGRRYELAMTQHHHRMFGRHLVRFGTLAQVLREPEDPPFMHVEGHVTPEISLYPERPYEGYQWGMVVNQSACFGCNACVVACQAENNIPVVGKGQVAQSREMHWLRIDSYFEDEYYERESTNPLILHQPVLCMHCEYAPCEPVCPVAATTHSDEGINEMTYNRCVGTRYCSNNCPYKVRRFNFYDYNRELREEPLRQLRPNPDVTVRSRGVMEKCTYCIQRINAGRIEADIENRPIRDGEIVTACQAACPTQALVFGNLNNPRSEVRQLAESSLNYPLLGDLNTRPRTTYLAAVRNPNPQLASGE